KSTVKYTKGKKSGKMTIWDEEGNQLELRNYENGQLDGKWLKWYPSSQLSAEEKYKEDLKQGTSTYWYENGNISREYEYVDDKLHGTTTLWAEYGEKTMEQEYLNGMLNGKSTEFYGKDRVFVKTDFVIDLIHGARIQFAPSGMMTRHELFLEDVPVSYISWDQEGTIREIRILRDNETVWQASWDKHKRRPNPDRWREKTHIKKEWHSNGRISVERDLLGKKKHGAEIQFYENGTLQRISLFQKDEIIALLGWDKKSRLIAVEIFNEGEMIWAMED
ncbi:MAG TPA: toxin-antitoxin system YwqK family antitoxin, partial [Candidatus Marinimicrobia bacterium]|nr:toxin-antitoxin system YwqK family antitoxin [Candidatus Neomarinimicrobiota bacterium]